VVYCLVKSVTYSAFIIIIIIIFIIIKVIKSRRLRWAGHVARMGESRGAYRALVGKPEGRRPLGRSRRRWEDTLKRIFERLGGMA
jgi:hypothetical protein